MYTIKTTSNGRQIEIWAYATYSPNGFVTESTVDGVNTGVKKHYNTLREINLNLETIIQNI